MAGWQLPFTHTARAKSSSHGSGSDQVNQFMQIFSLVWLDNMTNKNILGELWGFKYLLQFTGVNPSDQNQFKTTT